MFIEPKKSLNRQIKYIDLNNNNNVDFMIPCHFLFQITYK